MSKQSNISTPSIGELQTPFKLNISFGEAMKKALNTPIPDSKIFKKIKTKKPKN